MLVQTDWDHPGTANTFGWSLKDAKPEEPAWYEEGWRENPELISDIGTKGVAEFEQYEKQCACEHDGTDGTVACDKCGMTASQFICAAGEWLNDNDGAEAEDPGYFDQD